MAKVKIEWQHQVPLNIRKIVEGMVRGMYEASELAVEVIGNKSQEQVPFDIGTLRDSWEVKPLKGEIGFEMSYNTDYAHRLHEHPEYKFKNGRKAKYLEDPIEQNLGDWQGKFLSKLKEIKFE